MKVVEMLWLLSPKIMMAQTKSMTMVLKRIESKAFRSKIEYSQYITEYGSQGEVNMRMIRTCLV